MTRKAKAGIAIFLLALAVAVFALVWRKTSTPPLKNSDFFPGNSPPNLAVIRPTHFANRTPQMLGSTSEDGAGRTVTQIAGQDVSFQDMIQTAYGNETQMVSQARIVFPPDVPTAKFDYLVTMPDNPEEHLQTAIKDKFGYVGNWETRNTDVLALKVETAGGSGIRVSTSKVRSYKGGNFTHYHIGILVHNLEYHLNQPVLDQTGLTNFYDFYWSLGQTNRSEIADRLANLGLRLEPTNEPIQLLIVHKAR